MPGRQVQVGSQWADAAHERVHEPVLLQLAAQRGRADLPGQVEYLGRNRRHGCMVERRGTLLGCTRCSRPPPPSSHSARYQDEIERERRIAPPLVDELRAAGLYRMVIPRALGGLEVDVLTSCAPPSLMAEADGSVGWNLGNNAVGQLIALSLPEAGVEEIFADGPDAIVAGTAVPGGGTAQQVEGGYLVTGRWPFGSGCRESSGCCATSTSSSTVRPRSSGTPPHGAGHGARQLGHDRYGAHGQSRLDDPGRLRAHPAHGPRRRAPAGQSVQRWSGTLYQLPVHALVGPHHSGRRDGHCPRRDRRADGPGRRQSAARRRVCWREQERVQDAVARAEAVLGGAQLFRACAVGEVWDTVAAGAPSTLAQRARCRLAATFAVDSARQAMDLVYRVGGTTSSQRSHQLARCWRDLHVVAQAASIAPDWYALTGRALLGLDPGGRLT